MRRPQFSPMTLLWLMALLAAGAGVAANIARHRGQIEGAYAMVLWITIGGIIGGFVGLTIREPMAFLLLGVGVDIVLLVLASAVAMVW